MFEKINDYAEESVKSDLLMKIRLSLANKICTKYADETGTISAFQLSDKTVEELVMFFEDDENSVVKVDGVFAEKLAIGLTVLYCIEAVVDCAERNLIQFKLCFLPVNRNHDSIFGSRAAMI